MARPLTGLSQLTSYGTLIEENSQASPEDRMGGVVDPSHAKGLAEDYIPRGSRIGVPVGPKGPENQLLSDETWFWESGGDPSEDPDMDHTPSNRAGPWPKGIMSGPVGSPGPDDTGPKLAQLAALHGIKTNASARFNLDRDFAQQDEWQEIWEQNPGHSDLVQLPKQAMSGSAGWGTRDRTNSMAAQNEFGYDTAHMHRRFATGSIPGNYMWLRPGGRPIMKSRSGGAHLPIGDNSPFTGQDVGTNFGIDGAVLQSVPYEYTAPPTPALQAAPDVSDGDTYVEWY